MATSDDASLLPEWWTCPKCGGVTRVLDEPPPHRACNACDWSVTIPEAVDGDQ